jgi:hypothetical protein
VLANTIFEDAVEKIFDVTKRFAAALEAENQGSAFEALGAPHVASQPYDLR